MENPSDPRDEHAAESSRPEGGEPEGRRRQGDVLVSISEGIVGLYRDFYGKGPTRAKSYYTDELVVCVLRGGFTRAEQTLRESGRADAVTEQRKQFQQAMAERFKAVVSGATGRKVVAYISGSHQDPDLLCEVFVLAPTELLDPEGSEP